MFIQQNADRLHRHPALLLGILALVGLSALAGCDLFFGHGPGSPDDGIVRAVVKAPVAPDGDVAGRTTDLVLNLDVSMDPNEAGFALHAGDQIRVTLPKAFEKTSDLPLFDIFACLAQNLQCDTAVLLLGWPQGALGAPPPIGYEVHYEGSHTLVFTATEDHLPDPPSNPGLKQIHLLLNNFANPRPGLYEIGVELATQNELKYGRGRVHIRPRPRPSIEVTNAFHAGFANGNFQETSPGTLAPLPFDFLLWNRTGAAFEGVTLEGRHLMLGRKVIGQVSIAAPAGATGQEVFAEEASTRVSAPVTGLAAGHLRVFFRAGSATGDYAITFGLNGGTAVQMIVRVR